MDLIEIPEDAAFSRHPWELARYRFFAGLLATTFDSDPTALLDAGAGDGWFARRLAVEHPELTVTCLDPGYAEPGVAERLPEAERVSYTAADPVGPFDVLTLLDVLEHVEDDAALLRTLADEVRPGGRVLISVPAWPRLFSRHDAALLHFRRYTPRALADVVRRVGLTPLARGGLFHSLLLPRAVSVGIERLRPHEDAGAQTPEHRLELGGGELVRRVVERALEADTRLSRAAAEREHDLPGLSCWVLCRRP